MTRPPVLARALLRALLPDHEVVDALDGDLAEGFTRRAETSPGRARWWYRRKVLTLPYVALNREIRRLRAKEGSKKVRMGGGWMGGMTMDLRIAVRSLSRRPAFTGVAIVTLALSVGAATLLFSVVDGVLMTPLPYESPDELVSVYLTNDAWRDGDNEILRTSSDSHTLTLDHAEAFRGAPGPLRDLAAYTYRSLPLRTDGPSGELATAIMMDGHLFGVLGVTPSVGRLPSGREIETSENVAVLRHETWISRFGGDPDVLGRAFGFGEETYTVVGVMPTGFFFPTEDGGDLWIPVTTQARGWPSFYSVARLSPGSDVADATEFLERVARRMGEDDPLRAGFGARAMRHLDAVVGNVQGGIHLLFGTTLLVVLVACVNLANLFLARATGRREELAVRSSLGAGTGSLVTVMLSEAVVIGLVGGSLGIALAAGALDPFVEALGASLRGLPRQAAIGLDGRVLLFSLAATLVTTLTAGLGPTLASARRAPASALGGRGTGSGDGAHRSQRLLLGCQAALTVVLVSAAGLLGRSFLAAVTVDMGMDTGRVAVLEVESEQSDAWENIRQRVAALPGVSAVGWTIALPSRGGVLLLEARPESTPASQSFPLATVFAGEGYFDALGIPILVGEGFRQEDQKADKVVISEGAAMQFFGRLDVVGRQVVRGSDEEPRPAQIVGVVGDARQLSPFQEPTPTLYYPVRAAQSDRAYLAMAVEGNPAAILEMARQTALSTEPTVEVQRAATLNRLMLESLRHIRLRMLLMASLAALAAVLAMIGISGVVAHYLSQQVRNVGIRMALGAASNREVGRVVRHALAPTVLGLGAGLVVAVASSRVMESFVFGVEPTDPVTYAAVAVLMLLTAATAAWVPARRPAAVDPARVLKGE